MGVGLSGPLFGAAGGTGVDVQWNLHRPPVPPRRELFLVSQMYTAHLERRGNVTRMCAKPGSEPETKRSRPRSRSRWARNRTLLDVVVMHVPVSPEEECAHQAPHERRQSRQPALSQPSVAIRNSLRHHEPDQKHQNQKIEEIMHPKHMHTTNP